MSGKHRKVQHSMQGVFVFVLLGLFAVMSTLMVLLGAQMYRNTVDHSTANNEDRVLSAYVRSMIRAEDTSGAMEIGEYNGVKALAMREDLDGETYVTWLYLYEGQLRELFTDVGYGFNPDSGVVVAPANSFEPSLEGGLLTVRMTDDKDRDCTVRVALRCPQ